MPEFNVIESNLTAGLSVIEASAGTGKTYAISRLVPKLILDPDSGIDSLSQILLVTFTNDAARELSDRVRKALEKFLRAPEADEKSKDPAIHDLRVKYGGMYGEEGLRQKIASALLEIDRLNVSTIHSFCQKTLQSEGALCGLPVMPELIGADDGIVTDALKDYWEQKIATSPEMTDLAESQKLSFDRTLQFIRDALSIETATLVPACVGFEQATVELASHADSFTGEICSELTAIFDKVPKWNKAGNDSAMRSSTLGILEAATKDTLLGNFSALWKFCLAVMAINSSPGWIPKKKNCTLSQDCSVSRAVTLTNKILPLINKMGWEFQNSCLLHCRKVVRETLHARRQLSYDGLIERMHSALTGVNADELAARIRKQYSIALVDESQDTDPVQYGIFSRIFLDGDHRLVLIGDPKQAIYAFRGADVNTYLKARTLAEELQRADPQTPRIFSLTKTFRAPQELVDATNALFLRSGSLLKEGMNFTPSRSGLAWDVQLHINGKHSPHRIEILNLTGALTESDYDVQIELVAENTASEIVRILNDNSTILSTKEGENPKDVAPGDFAVLVSNNKQASAVEKALKTRGVPAVRAGGDDVMASEEAVDLLAILKALDDPRRKALRFTALATRILGKTGADLRKLNETEDAGLDSFLRWEQVFLTKGIAPAISLIDRELDVTARLAAGPDGDRRVTNLRQLTDLLQTALLEHGNNASQLLRWYGGEIRRAESRSDSEERQIQLESDAEAVKVVTMHSAKGLEYPLVFCPFLWTIRKVSKKFPKGIKKLNRVNGSHLINTDLCEGADYIHEIDRTAIEDALRLAYVAITRARVKVWIHAGGYCSTPSSSPLDWLLRTNLPVTETQEAEAVPAPEIRYDDWNRSFESGDRGRLHSKGLSELKAAVPQSHGLVEVSPSAPNGGKWIKPNADVTGELVALPSRLPDQPWRLTSFSSLTKEKNPHGSSSGTGDATILSEQPENLFFDVPGSNVLGTAVHDWIEQWNFEEPDHTFDERVKAHLDNYTFPKTKADAPLRTPVDVGVPAMLRQLRDAILPGFGVTIAEACPKAASSEWHFQLPIDGLLSPRRLAESFKANPQKGFEDYHLSLSELKADELTGFLHGFIDRLAVNLSTGHWGVIDWKTNTLGKHIQDYNGDSLRKCAMKDHYFLQTQLYLLALRRYLGPDTVIKGAWLVFLRGITTGSDRGILRIPYDERLITSLDSMFVKPSTVRRS